VPVSTDEDGIDTEGDAGRGHGRRRRRRRPQTQHHHQQQLSHCPQQQQQQQYHQASKGSKVIAQTEETMTSLERLIRTHPIWFLPSVVSGNEASELLAGKEQGVRQTKEQK